MFFWVRVPFANETGGATACLPGCDGSALMAWVPPHKTKTGAPVSWQRNSALYNFDMGASIATEQYSASLQFALRYFGESLYRFADLVSKCYQTTASKEYHRSLSLQAGQAPIRFGLLSLMWTA
jgi:hypothetical protein